MSVDPGLSVLIVGDDGAPVSAVPGLDDPSLAGVAVEWVLVERADRAGAASAPGDPRVRRVAAPGPDPHAAFNRGVAACRGALILPLQPDDRPLPGAVARLLDLWRSIPPAGAAAFGGVAGAAIPRAGAPLATGPFDRADADPGELTLRFGWRDEPLFALRAELFRARPLPSPGAGRISLPFVWRFVGHGYLTRAVAEPLAIRLPRPPSDAAARFAALELLSEAGTWLRRAPVRALRAGIVYHRASRRLGSGLRQQARHLTTWHGRLIWALTLPAEAMSNRQSASNVREVESVSRGRTAVVLLTRSLELGGAERQLVTLAIGLHRRGHDVRVVVFYPGPLEQDLRDAAVPTTVIGKRGRWDLPGFLLRLARTLRAARPAIVHGYLSASNTLALLLAPLHGGRVVWGLRASNIDMARYDWLANLDAGVERALARRVPLMIANSEAGRRYAAAQGFPAERIVVIRNGVDLDRFRPDPAGGERLRAAWGIPPDAPLVGRVGRLDPQKDHETFLGAAAILARRRPEMRFACIGTGNPAREAELKRLASDFGLDDRLVWTGAVTTMAAAYSALDLAVSSSAYGEGVPNVVAEAMACGVPAVATDIGDSAWVVADPARVVPDRDPAALAAAIERALDDQAEGRVDAVALRCRIEATLSTGRLLDQTEAALGLPRRAEAC